METITLENIKGLQKEVSVIVRRRVNNGNTRPRYRLEKSLKIKLSNGFTYMIPEGFEWDLSSVPRLLWGLLPPDGSFELASMIHDYLYINKITTRKFADDEMLLWSKVVSGTNSKVSLRNFDNQVRYIAVRLFGRVVWNRGKSKR